MRVVTTGDEHSDAEILLEAGPGLPPWEGPPPRIEVLFQDEHLVAVDKPPGLLVHRVSPDAPEKTVLLQTVRDQLGKHLYPIQRLDRPASGVIVFGLSRAAAAAIQRSLEGPGSHKEYLVLAAGECPASFESRRPLRSQAGQPQEAWTSFERLAPGPGCTLLRARLHTGRYHQLRRHLAHLGHPVLGDTTYGKEAANAAFRDAHGLQRLFLHAARLVVEHPATGQPLELTAPLAADLRAVLRSAGLAEV